MKQTIRDNIGKQDITKDPRVQTSQENLSKQKIQWHWFVLQKRESALRSPKLTVSVTLARKRLRDRRMDTPAVRLRKDSGSGKETVDQ